MIIPEKELSISVTIVFWSKVSKKNKSKTILIPKEKNIEIQYHGFLKTMFNIASISCI